MGWLRLDEDVLNSKGVAKAAAELGALGPAAWMFTLTKAKRDNKGGLVELTPIVMARELGVTSDQAAVAITTLATTAGLVELTTTADVYIVPNWPEYQPDARAPGRERAARASQGQPGTERDTLGQTGQRDGTGRDGKTTSARATPGSRRSNARAREAHEARQQIIAEETARLQALSGEPE